MQARIYDFIHEAVHSWVVFNFNRQLLVLSTFTFSIPLESESGLWIQLMGVRLVGVNRLPFVGPMQVMSLTQT
jgi:hypothetical protein